MSMKSDSSDDDKEGGEEGGDRYSDSMRSLFGDEETGGLGGAFEPTGYDSEEY